jgi:ParB family transcriptional regulator, chromosome partitioning protein
MEKRLGRGLAYLLTKPDSDESGGTIAIRLIRPNPYQPRKELNAVGLEELRNSIATHGVLQPILVRPAQDGYELISGERRWRAARLAGLETIPAVVRDSVSDEEMLELALVENVQRRDLSPIEKARGYQGLQESLGLTQEGVAARVGLRRSTVANHLRLLELPEVVQEAVGKRLLSMGHARALLGLSEEAARIALMEEAIRDDLSVREVERRVRAEVHDENPQSHPPEILAGQEQGEISAASTPVPWVQDLEDRFRRSLGTKVQLLNGPGYQGKIVIEYFDRDQLDRLVQQLAPSAKV